MQRNNGVTPLKVSREDLASALVSAQSLGQILITLGFPANNRNYNRLRELARQLEVELPKTTWSTKPLEEILVKDSFISRSTLKKRLLEEGILENICSKCGQEPWWHGEPLVLQLDHINGDPHDNRLENLRILCGHCHTQTKTFCGRKNAGLPKPRKQKYIKRVSYCGCGSTKAPGAGLCRSCRNLQPVNKIEWPSVEEVLEMLSSNTFLAVGKKLGVTDNAVRKFLTRNGIDYRTI